MKDIRIPRASGLVVKTAAKQECTAEGPGFESRLVHFYCSWGLLGCCWCFPGLVGPPGRPGSAPRAARSDPRAARSAPRAARSAPRAARSAPRAARSAPGGPRRAPRKGPEDPLERPWRPPGRPGGGSLLEATKHYILQCFVAWEATKPYNLHGFVASKALFFQAPEGPNHCMLRVPAFENNKNC